MSQSHNPKIVRDGLVLALDAANAKNSLKAIEVLVVAAGGGGVPDRGGGGGGGGVLTGTTTVTNQNYTITVGNGANGVTGGNSAAFGLTALGGGAGGSGSGSNGATGGSGGGAGNGSGADLITTGGLGTPGQGYNGGGSVYIAPNYGGGGGGGAGGPGQSGTQLLGGNGGPGIGSVISGALTYYGGGGGGGSYGGISYPAGTGGIGGGGNGSVSTAQSGSPNTGGGGGSNGVSGGTSTSGGSGIVIVRYKGSQKASGGTVTFINGYTVHTFTTSGTFTPNGAPGTGTVWTDVSKNGNSATLINGVGYNSANKGSFVFDGTVGKRATLTYNSTNFVNTNFTWIAWVLGQGSPTVNMPQIGYGTGGWPRLGFFENAGIWYFQQFNIAGPPATSNVSCGASSNTVWKQICCVGNYSSSQILGYNNGSYVAAAQYVDSSGNDSLFGIGRAGTTYEPWNEAFLGNISAIQIYNRALTVQEIQQNFNTLRGRFGI